MIGKELKKMSRRELLDIIYQMKKNEQRMQEEIDSLQEALQDKRIRLSEAGSVAEAAASITNLFSAAQMTADLYLQEITSMKEETERACAKKIDAANQTVTKIMSDGEKQYTELKLRYRADYKKWQQLNATVKALDAPEKQK